MRRNDVLHLTFSAGEMKVQQEVGAVSTQGNLSRPATGWREVAWRAGGFLFALLGIGSLGLLFAGLVLVEGGLAFLPLAVPPLVTAFAVLRPMRWARPLALVVGVAYGGIAAYVATTPWRGLTPADGQTGGPVDIGLALVAVVSVSAATLVLAGRAPHATRVPLAHGG